jgi:hypothetical protein
VTGQETRPTGGLDSYSFSESFWYSASQEWRLVSSIVFGGMGGIFSFVEIRENPWLHKKVEAMIQKPCNSSHRMFPNPYIF